ncbi:MAG: tRNA pseudouridine(55) synthase TruB [Chitinophagia bacterium]|jgi:tRNA pseudouridine55 synthase|nr:tRNA pseudouridine(55) synthase TruB [Chitinophagia bacterium]
MRQKPIPQALLPFLEGKVLLLDKPLGWTSFDIVKKVRWLTRVMKVGHAGTLDPLATGLLIVCTGKFTKQINTYMGMVKEYTGSLVLGATTDSYDLETTPQNFKSIDHLTKDQIHQATKLFLGEIWQMPPQHSAIKKDGKPLYLSARKGIEVKVDPRKVNIDCFEITNMDLPSISFRVVCSTGTYIRSLVKDYGEALGVGAYMSGLRRTKIGHFNVEAAQSWEQLENEIKDLLQDNLD